MDKADFQNFLLPLVISNIAGIIILYCSLKYKRTARLLIFLLFMWAGITNWYTAVNSPHLYLEYANFTFLLFYSEFIMGWFSRHILLMVGFIATGQLLIAASMLFKGPVFKLGTIGGMIFMAAIIPLGVGSGFPFPILGMFAFFFLFRRPNDHRLNTVKEIRLAESN